MSATIFVRLVTEGWHCWPQAPDHRAYLRDRHRHLFHIEVACSVDHDDREIEFHDLLGSTRLVLHAIGKPNFGTMSCEQIASHLANILSDRFGKPRTWRVTVSEDNECGATVVLSPEQA